MLVESFSVAVIDGPVGLCLSRSVVGRLDSTSTSGFFGGP